MEDPHSPRPSLKKHRMLQSWVERINADEYIKPRKDTRNLEPFMEWSLWCAIYDSVFVDTSYYVSILVLVDRFPASVTTERSLPQRGGVEGGGGFPCINVNTNYWLTFPVRTCQVRTIVQKRRWFETGCV